MPRVHVHPNALGLTDNYSRFFVIIYETWGTWSLHSEIKIISSINHSSSRTFLKKPVKFVAWLKAASHPRWSFCLKKKPQTIEKSALVSSLDFISHRFILRVDSMTTQWFLIEIYLSDFLQSIFQTHICCCFTTSQLRTQDLAVLNLVSQSQENHSMLILLIERYFLRQRNLVWVCTGHSGDGMNCILEVSC